MKRSNPYLDLPLTAARIWWMTVSVAVYVSQLLYGSVLGFCWFTLGKKTDARRLRFHLAMQRFFRRDLRMHPWLHARIHNPHHETFTRGSILICNHQSLLDTLCLLILSPRILMVTHDKVWNNPLTAAVLRYADFLSVSDTQWESRLDYCRSFIDKGYSIVIFPEGQRSADGNIQRFHKGAFYLAQQLGADLLPVFLHGAAHVLPLGKAFANPGGFYIEIGRRIPPSDPAWPADYTERCRQMHRYYLEHFEEIRYLVETPAYFRRMAVDLYASVGLRRQALAALREPDKDTCHITRFIEALVHPEQTVVLPASSPLQRLYKKYTHLPQNIQFV